MRPLKIVVVGPSKCGKSTLVDLISSRDHLSLTISSPTPPTPSKSYEYIETKGCRIVEVEKNNFETHSTPTPHHHHPQRNIDIKKYSSIQFWDVGGTSIHHPDTHLPAIIQDADGIVFMYNPNSPAQCSEIQQWFDIVAVVVISDSDMKAKNNKDNQNFLVVMNNTVNNGSLTDMDMISSVAASSSSIEQIPSCFDKMEKIQYSHNTENYEIRNCISAFVNKLSTM